MDLKDLSGAGALAKASSNVITKVIDRISSTTGILYEPTRIRRRARAEADARMIMAKSEIEITSLQRKALLRLANEECVKQDNMESIIEKALKDIDETCANPDGVSEDWLFDFFDKSRMYSDLEMQCIWAKLLSGEINHPGAFSRNSLRIMSCMDKADASCFSKLQLFVLGKVLFILDWNDEFYIKNGFDYDSLGRLSGLGLVNASYNAMLRPQIHFNEKSREHKLSYGMNDVIFKKKEPFTVLEHGYVDFTHSGREILRLCEVVTLEDFPKYLAEKYGKQNIAVTVSRKKKE